jgi:threonine dehydratase
MTKNSGLMVSLADIQRAKRELRKHLSFSPLLLNSWLSENFGCEVYLKLENMQPIGSFKIRGATNKIYNLSEKEKQRGVVAASFGNHAQGVAWGSRQLGVDAMIVMPKNAPLTKVQNTKSLGAEIVLKGETFDEAYAFAREIEKQTGRIFVHAFEDEAVIAGQGTIGLEILKQLPDVDMVIGAIGGGGMMAGTAIAIKSLRPQTKMIGCQASGADSMIRSMRKGRAIVLARVETFADGVAMGRASEPMRKLLASRLDEMLEANDEEIAAAVLTLMEKAKVVSEGAGALSLAVLDRIQKEIRHKKVVLIISGGNIDVNLLSRIIDRGLIRAGRRLRVNVWISDRTGSLARLTELLAREEVNIIQAIHDRSEPSTQIDQTEVALTLETRGLEHSKSVIRAIQGQVLKLELAH